MEVQFTPDQQALISNAIASGCLHRPEEAMQQALLLWEERERRRLEILAEVDYPKRPRLVVKAAASRRARNPTNSSATSPDAVWRGSPPSKLRADDLSPFRPGGSQLDDIWLYIARESGSVDMAIGVGFWPIHMLS
jgi:hypothetical protein